MTCAKCGVNPGSRPMAATDWCEECYLAFRDDVLNRVITEAEPVLVQRGAMRPDHGPGMADVECAACGATLVAVPFMTCPYCEVSWDRMAKWQAQTLLNPELPDPEDVRYIGATKGWFQRLGVGLSAEIVTEHQVRSAWLRELENARASESWRADAG